MNTASHPHPRVQENDTAPISDISAGTSRTNPVAELKGTSSQSTLELADQAIAPTQDHLQNGEGYQLTNRTLYITHEPCIMCTMALVHARVKEVVFIHSMPSTGGCGGAVMVQELKTINHRFNAWRWKDKQAIWPFNDALLVHETDV
jgi:tRNA-specific adenosine deaminase 3